MKAFQGSSRVKEGNLKEWAPSVAGDNGVNEGGYEGP